MKFRHPIPHHIRMLLQKHAKVGQTSSDDDLGLGAGWQRVEGIDVNPDRIGITLPLITSVAVIERIGSHVFAKQRLIVELRGVRIVGP
jgi:hypothetical protein